MDYKIDVLRKKKQVKIGDDITQLNQGLLNRLHGDRHKCDIYMKVFHRNLVSKSQSNLIPHAKLYM